MRAKFIYESIDFERGKKPSEALEIGKFQMTAIKRVIEDLGKKYKTTPEVLDSNPEHYSTGIAIGKYFYTLEIYRKKYYASWKLLDSNANNYRSFDNIKEAKEWIINSIED